MMSELTGKRRMISLRLSEVEYEVLKKLHRSYGARSVSDLTRLALQRIMREPAILESDFATKLAELDGRMNALESHVSVHLEAHKAASVRTAAALTP
jgi:hypothetical protein